MRNYPLAYNPGISAFRENLLEYIERVGITSIRFVSWIFNQPEHIVRLQVYRLSGLGEIVIPCKGIILSRKWIDNNPEKVECIENQVHKKIGKPTLRKV